MFKRLTLIFSDLPKVLDFFSSGPLTHICIITMLYAHALDVE